MDNLVSDGNAVTVTLEAGHAVTKGQLVFADGFHGVAQRDGDGDTTDNVVSLETSNREFETEVPGALSIAKGDKVYLTEDGNDTITTTGTDRLVGIATTAKDANNVIWYKLLENN